VLHWRLLVGNREVQMALRMLRLKRRELIAKSYGSSQTVLLKEG
jgi:hypothetical protein